MLEMPRQLPDGVYGTEMCAEGCEPDAPVESPTRSRQITVTLPEPDWRLAAGPIWRGYESKSGPQPVVAAADGGIISSTGQRSSRLRQTLVDARAYALALLAAVDYAENGGPAG